MRILGAILCGGRSIRFGADKAAARLDGVTLFDHVRAALAPQVEAIVACGRPLAGVSGLADRPAPGMGPLAGINAALHAARDGGYDAVLTVPCDTPLLPPDLVVRLAPAPGYVAALPVIGLWPATLAPHLDDHLAATARRAVRGWAEAVGAAPVTLGLDLPNINHPADLAGLQARS